MDLLKSALGYFQSIEKFLFLNKLLFNFGLGMTIIFEMCIRIKCCVHKKEYMIKVGKLKNIHIIIIINKNILIEVL